MLLCPQLGYTKQASYTWGIPGLELEDQQELAKLVEDNETRENCLYCGDPDTTEAAMRAHLHFMNLPDIYRGIMETF